MDQSVDTRRNGRAFSASETLPYIQSPHAERPVVLQRLEIEVKVTGLFAETTQTMHFFNPNNRDFEGQLFFPLPSTGVVCGYGLDVDGGMVDGVIVPKKRARQILEAEERKGADPGLVEQVQGNIYRTRIYPLPARGQRTFKITYTSDLTLVGNEAVYDLPLQHAKEVEQVSLRIEVNQSPHKPKITGGQGNVTLTDWHQAWVAEAVMEQGVITEDLQIRLPDLADTIEMIEKTEDDDLFFCVSHLVEEIAHSQEWKPQKVAIAWDASGSRMSIDRDIAFLNQIFSIWHECTIDVMVFRNRIETETKTFTVNLDNIHELTEYLQSLPSDGATSLSSLDFAELPEGAEAWLLFSDGFDTIRKGLPTIGATPIYPVVSQTSANRNYLKYLAGTSGGVLIDLVRFNIQESCRQLVASKNQPAIKKSSGVEDLRLFHQGKRVVISGKLSGTEGSVTLAVPGNENLDFQFFEKDAVAGLILARQWADQKIQEYCIAGNEDCEEAVELARQYSVVSPSTSLLVLENLEQYIEYNVEPPASLSEMRMQYHQQKNEAHLDKEKDKKEHIERVATLWQERVAWWERDFHKEYAAKKKEQNVQRSWIPTEQAAYEDDECYDSLDDVDEAPLLIEEGSNLFMSSVRQDLDINASAPESFTTGQEPVSPAASTITIQQWSPSQPYLKLIQSAEPEGQYAVYLGERERYMGSPSFFLDCGDYFLSKGQKETGIRVLSNLLEMQLEDVGLMRIYGWRLQQAGELDGAIEIFEQVLKLRDDEPQSYRDLALALGERWEQNEDDTDALRAMELLYEVVGHCWERFPEIELIALVELNRMIHLAGKKQIAVPEYIDPRFIKLLDLDIRISLSWDADLTDVDLHLFEPNGDHAYYGHPETVIGGLVSRDFRDGYGPEEYVLKKAIPGNYTIKANYFASHQQSLCGPCTVIVNIFTNYARPEEKKQVLTLRLEESGEDSLIGEITIAEDESTNKNLNKSKEIEFFRKIKAGMNMGQVIDLVGSPDRVDHDEESGILILFYKLPAKVQMRIAMKYEVVSVSQLMEGAVVELL